MTRSRQRYLLRAALGLLWVAFLLGHALGEYRLGLVERLEVWTYDLRLLATAAGTPRSPVVIVDIDEASLGRVGRWPWPRHVLAALVDELVDRQGAAVVAFDVVFAEPDESSGLPILEALAEGALQAFPAFGDKLEELRPELDRDVQFARALQRRPVVLGYYFSSGENALRVGQLPGPVFHASDFGDRQIPLTRADGFGANLPILQQAAAGAGHFTPFFDADGRSRRVPLLIDFEGAYYEALALAAVRAFLGGVPVRPVFGESDGGVYVALEAIEVAGRRIPLDRHGAALVPFVGRQGSFPYVSAADVLAGVIEPGALTGGLVLVGTSATGLMDLRATPVGNAYPGVEIHANLVHGMLHGSIRQEPQYLAGFEILALLLAGGLLALSMPRWGPATAIVVAVGSLAAIVLLGLYLWSAYLLVMPMAVLLLAVGGIYALDTVYALFVENREKARVSALFGQYVPQRVVDALAENPRLASMQGESRAMSVLFADIRDFTSISEGLPAQELTGLMNDYLSVMTRAIQSQDGTVDKYIGDAIMAFWGAPLPRADHALGAVRTALAMQQAAGALRETYRRRGWPALHVGIGINTGVMSVGNMGSEFRRAYTVMGDAVNLASRLEALTRQYGVGVLVSEATRVATEHAVHYRELDRIRVKGKQQAVGIHEALLLRDGPGETLPAALEHRCATYAAMLTAYRARDWGSAEAALVRLESLGEAATLVALFRARIAMFRVDPPEAGWEGIFRFDAK